MTSDLPIIRYIVENDVNDESIRFDIFSDAFDYAINESNNNENVRYAVMEFVDGISTADIKKVWDIVNGDLDQVLTPD